MSNSYLDKFRSTLPNTQGKQILNILISKRDSGEIKNVNEFRARLTELTKQILEERITPTLTLFNAIAGHDASSELFNEMLDRIHDDLETIFVEADNIDDIIEAHHNLIENVSLKAIRFGINELESKIGLYEFLQKNQKGFSDALFNTFRESVNHLTSRSDNNAGLLYVDPRLNANILSSEDSFVDLLGERLTLGTSDTKDVVIKNVNWLSGPNSIRSELDVSFKNSRIANITDNKNNTFWVESILLSQAHSVGVPMELELDFGAVLDLNVLELEPATNFPMTLLGIDYIDSSNTRQSLPTSAIDLKGPIGLNFQAISTSKVILRLRQKNFQEVQFTKKKGESNFHRAVLSESIDNIDIESVSEELQDLLSSDFILNSVFNIDTSTQSQYKFYEYVLGFDNIRAKFNTYNDRGIYVTEEKLVDNPGLLSLKVDEYRPEQVAGSSNIQYTPHTYPQRTTEEDSKFYHSSTEYYAVSQSFSEDDYLISTDFIPILPLNTKRIYHERLLLTSKTSTSTNNNAGSLRFYTLANSSDVLIYRNGTLLSNGADWEFVDSADTEIGDLTITTPGAGTPMKRGIKISGTVNLLDIYTVSYTPVFSNTQTIPSDTTLMQYVDLIGDKSARITQDQLVVFDRVRNSYKVSYAKMYLLVLMRRNSAEENFSPLLEEYMLVTGSIDQSRFTGS